MVKSRKHGKRHPLVTFRRAMDQLWSSTLILAVLLSLAWVWLQISADPRMLTGKASWLLLGASVSLVFTLFAYLARYMAYVQPNKDHLRLVTPFLRLNISYRCVRSVHPAGYKQIFPFQETGGTQRRFPTPFYSSTLVVVELTSYPMAQALLRLFLSPQFFSRKETALVFHVPDWMAFITELDTFRGSWQQTQVQKSINPYDVH